VHFFLGGWRSFLALLLLLAPPGPIVNFRLSEQTTEGSGPILDKLGGNHLATAAGRSQLEDTLDNGDTLGDLAVGAAHDMLADLLAPLDVQPGRAAVSHDGLAGRCLLALNLPGSAVVPGLVVTLLIS